MASSTSSRDTFIVCRNSQGTEFRATLLRLTRYLVVFEVYNPYSILQLSEVLLDFRIVMTDRMVYSGRAVVSNLLNTGIMLVCEATLEDSWLDVDLFQTSTSPQKLQEEFLGFMAEWEKNYQVLPNFKVVISDMQMFLIDLRRWLDQVELGVRSNPSGEKTKIERDAIQQLERSLFPAVKGIFEKFEEAAGSIPEDLQTIHRAYGRRQIHPFVLCSPFVYRVFHKPLGYAGDYEMVNMMLRDPLEGSSIFAKVLNYNFIQQPPCEAHRNRISYLTALLSRETQRIVSQGRDARIFNLGCGPAREVQNFLGQFEICDRADFTLLDFNDETLEYTTSLLQDLKGRFHRKTPLRMVKRSVNQILKDAMKPSPPPDEKDFDLVYCAGLFDYLSDRICKKLMNYFYEILAPGGLLVATNVDKSNPIRQVMETFLEWHLVYRDRKDFLALKPDNAPEDSCEVKSDPTGVNIFLEVRKPCHG